MSSTDTERDESSRNPWIPPAPISVGNAVLNQQPKFKTSPLFKGNEPPGITGANRIPPTFHKLNSHGKIGYLYRFWARRADSHYFWIRAVQDLSYNPIVVMNFYLRQPEQTQLPPEERIQVEFTEIKAGGGYKYHCQYHDPKGNVGGHRTKQIIGSGESYVPLQAAQYAAAAALKSILGWTDKENDRVVEMSRAKHWIDCPYFLYMLALGYAVKGVSSKMTVGQVLGSPDLRVKNVFPIVAPPENTCPFCPVHSMIGIVKKDGTRCYCPAKPETKTAIKKHSSPDQKESSRDQKESNPDPMTSVEELLKYLLEKDLPEAEFNLSDVYHVRCVVRNKAFDAVYPNEEQATNIAALQALEYLFGHSLDS